MLAAVIVVAGVDHQPVLDVATVLRVVPVVTEAGARGPTAAHPHPQPSTSPPKLVATTVENPLPPWTTAGLPSRRRDDVELALEWAHRTIPPANRLQPPALRLPCSPALNSALHFALHLSTPHSTTTLPLDRRSRPATVDPRSVRLFFIGDCVGGDDSGWELGDIRYRG